MVCQTCFDITKQQKVVSCLVEDKDTVKAMQLFLEHHRVLVEPACGASLSLIYTRQDLLQPLQLATEDTIVVVVCGGAVINSSLLDQYKRQFSL